MNLDLLVKTGLCPICNYAKLQCICPKAQRRSLITQVVRKQLSRKKVVSLVFGRISLKHFTLIKTALGVGGKWGLEVCTFRGENQKRLIAELKKLNYQLPS